MYKMIMKKIIYIFSILIVLIFVIVSTQLVFGQDTVPKSKFGIFAGYGLNYYNAEFTELPGIPNCCPKFDGALGSGYSIGLSGDYLISDKLYLGWKFAFVDISAPFKAKESVPVRVDDNIIDGIFEHSLNIHLNGISIQPNISYNLFSNFFASGGVNFTYLINRRFDQREEIVEPANRGVFVETDTRVRNINSGILNSVKSIFFGPTISFSYELPVNERGTWKIAPEISIAAGLTSMVDAYDFDEATQTNNKIDWKIYPAALTLSLKYTPLPPKKIIYFEEYRYNPAIDTIIVESSKYKSKTYLIGKANQSVKIDTNFSAKVIIFTRTEQRTDTIFVLPKPVANIAIDSKSITVQAHYVTEAFPLLPIIFFDSLSYEIPNNYITINNIREFSEETISTNPVLFHKNLLNIIGYRLLEFPESKITLIGTSDSTTEKSSCALARSRAETVKKYFENVWQINSDRIIIKTEKNNCSPSNPTQTQNEMGWADNRRVELSGTDNRVFTPILRKRFLQATEIVPSKVEINTAGTTFENIKSWSISASQPGLEVFSASGDTAISTISFVIGSEQAARLSQDSPLNIEFKMTDMEGNQVSANSNIAIQKDVSEYEVERISLVLFNVGSDKLDNESEKSIKEFIKDLDEKTSKIRIIGYTDMLGNQEINKQLSINRAKNTQLFIKKIKPGAEISEALGVSASSYPPGISSYSTAAERFLSRTVQIEIVKKMK